MSLGFRLPNFPISQKISAHLAQHDLGNWEIGKYIPLQISQFPNFPNRAEPDGLRSFGKLGNWEICTLQPFPFPISQIVLSQMGWLRSFRKLGNWEVHTSTDFPISQWAEIFWDTGKLGNLYLQPFPNFPISQKTPAQMGQHDLGNWEMA